MNRKIISGLMFWTGYFMLVILYFSDFKLDITFPVMIGIMIILPIRFYWKEIKSSHNATKKII